MAKNTIDKAAINAMLRGRDVKKGVFHYANELLTEADLEVPYDTGMLSLSGRVEETNKGYAVVYGNDTDVSYAPHVYFGTKAHGPRYAKALHWIGKDGKDVFAKWVKGIKANPWLERAIATLAGRNQ